MPELEARLFFFTQPLVVQDAASFCLKNTNCGADSEPVGAGSVHGAAIVLFRRSRRTTLAPNEVNAVRPQGEAIPM